MTSHGSAIPRMPVSAASVEQVVFEAMCAASADKAVRVCADTEVLQIVDSLGLMMSLANIQAALNVRLEPKEIIGVLQARSIRDVTLALTRAMETRCKQSV